MRRAAAFSLLVAGTIVVSALPRARADVVLQFDYTYDASGFFASGSDARATLEAAGDFFESILDDDLTAINSNFRNRFDGFVRRPDTGETVTLFNYDVPADTIVIFAGARDLDGSAVGQAGPNGYNVSYFSSSWYENVQTRGEGSVDDVQGPAATDFATWGGSLALDDDTTWNLDHTAAPRSGQTDLYSVALHELGHILGLATADSWDNLINDDNQFTGPVSVMEYGGNVPLQDGGAHFSSGTRSTVFPGGPAQEAAMDPEITVGTRKLFTDLDVAALDDVGWDIHRTIAYWIDPGGGDFSDPGNWRYAEAPETDDAVVFDVAGTYDVDFHGHTPGRQVSVHDGDVTFHLATFSYSLGPPGESPSVVVGGSSGADARLTISNGTLSGHAAAVAAVSGTTGRVTATGAGTQWTLADSLSIGGSIDAAGGSGTVVIRDGATLTVAGTLKIWSGDQLDLDGGAATVGALDLASGTVTGNGELTISGGPSRWTGGTMSGAGTTTLGSGRTLEISGSPPKQLAGRVIQNAGSTALAGSGNLRGADAALFNNLADALFDVQSDADLEHDDGTRPEFNNTGTFRKSAGTGTTYVDWTLHNAGNLEVQSGTLSLGGAFDHTGTADVQAGTLHLAGGGASSGTFDVAAGGVLSFGGGTYILDAGTTIRGAGKVNFSGGTFHFPLHNDVVVTTGDIDLGGSLGLQVLGRFGPVGSYGDQPDMTLIRTSEDRSISSQFVNYPAGRSVLIYGFSAPRHPHLGHGVFLGRGADAPSEPGQAVFYREDPAGAEGVAVRVDVHVWQAAPGDRNGDRKTDFDDIWEIVSAGKYDQGPGPDVGWTDGDFDDNGRVDFDDIWLVVQSGLYDAGPYAATTRVNPNEVSSAAFGSPMVGDRDYGLIAEPGTVAMLAVGVLGLLLVTRGLGLFPCHLPPTARERQRHDRQSEIPRQDHALPEPVPMIELPHVPFGS